VPVAAEAIERALLAQAALLGEAWRAGTASEPGRRP
jgi:hypothetical protein